MQLDKENTQRNNMNKKYLIVLLWYNNMILLFVFIVFYTLTKCDLILQHKARAYALSECLILSNTIDKATTHFVKIIQMDPLLMDH